MGSADARATHLSPCEKCEVCADPGWLGRDRREGAWRRITILALLAGGTIAAHYLTPAVHHEAILHDIYRRILYLPVLLAAFWFGWRGGLACAVVIGAAYFPHIYHDWGGDFFSVNLNRTLEVVMYLIVGVVTGLLVDRLHGAYARLQRQSEELRETLAALREKTREAIDTEHHLRQAERLTTIGQLTTGLAHEIRNPLGSIRGAAEILGDDDTAPDRRREFSRILIEETERLDGVLRNFLDYARSQKPGQPASAELPVVLARLFALLDMKLRNAGIEIQNRVPASGLPPLRVSEALLQQVVLNLVLNATQAMPGGGVLTLEASHDVARQRVRIAIADTGPGIPEAVRARIFEPFFTTKPGGTGLGLAIVQKIVLGNDGTIALDEATDQGTRILIEFPAL